MSEIKNIIEAIRYQISEYERSPIPDQKAIRALERLLDQIVNQEYIQIRQKLVDKYGALRSLKTGRPKS